MRFTTIKKYGIAEIAAVGFTAFHCIISYLFFRNLDRIVPVVADLIDISLPDSIITVFTAMHHAEIQPPILIVFLICTIIAAFFAFLIHKKSHLFLVIPVTILLCIVTIPVSILLTNVNTVQFFKVLKALLPLL